MPCLKFEDDGTGGKTRKNVNRDVLEAILYWELNLVYAYYKKRRRQKKGGGGTFFD